VESLAAAHGFSALEHQLEVEGLCASCRPVRRRARTRRPVSSTTEAGIHGRPS
jgi:hypothetical protein